MNKLVSHDKTIKLPRTDAKGEGLLHPESASQMISEVIIKLNLGITLEATAKPPKKGSRGI